MTIATFNISNLVCRLPTLPDCDDIPARGTLR
jgi:hypothetical protein